MSVPSIARRSRAVKRWTGPVGSGPSGLRAQCESYLDEFKRVKKRQRERSRPGLPPTDDARVDADESIGTDFETVGSCIDPRADVEPVSAPIMPPRAVVQASFFDQWEDDAP